MENLKDMHEFLMDLRDEIECQVSESMYNKLDDYIDFLNDLLGNNGGEV